MTMPRVSVVLAVFNGERHLSDAVDSILQQTFGDFELIVIDDGSTDRTPEILSGFQRVDPRVSVVRQENHGLTASLIRGAALARAPYVARQDADDISKPERLERQAAYLNAHPSTAAVGTEADIIDESGASVHTVNVACGPNEVKDGLLSSRKSPVHGSMMLRADAFRAVGGYREAFRMCQDYDLWLRLCARFPIDNLPDTLYEWRLNAGSVYGSQRRTQLKYHGIALAFHHEREQRGGDSYDLLEACDGQLDEFVERYPLAAFVRATWGELLLRNFGNSASVREQFRRAVFGGDVRPRTMCLLGWSHLFLPWPGGRPLAVAERTE